MRVLNIAIGNVRINQRGDEVSFFLANFPEPFLKVFGFVLQEVVRVVVLIGQSGDKSLVSERLKFSGENRSVLASSVVIVEENNKFLRRQIFELFPSDR